MSVWTIHPGDTRASLARLPERSVRCCVTSPPYFGLRDYGHDGQIGLEASPAAYIAALVEVFAGVRRVLTDDGTLWVNLGDSYTAHAGNRNGKNGSTINGKNAKTFAGAFGDDRKAKTIGSTGVKPKDLLGIPWRVAFALQADGWYLRSDIIWHKPNPMPESVTDRPTKAHEYLFLLAKNERYFYDADAIAEPCSDEEYRTRGKVRPTSDGGVGFEIRGGLHRQEGGRETRNKRDVWSIPTQPYSGAHFATFPEALVEPCILAGSAVGDTVLDPFSGSGTTGAVAVRHGRNYIGCELNPAYIKLSEARIGKEAPLFAKGGAV